MRKGDLIFCYGTLRIGASSDLSRNPDVDFVSSDAVNGRLYALGWFPGVKDVPSSGEPQAISGLDTTPQYFNPGEPFVYGDVFKILDDRVVAHLDAYEGYPSLYDRVETESADGRHVWVYTYNHEVQSDQQIVSGDWIAEQSLQPVPANTAG